MAITEFIKINTEEFERVRDAFVSGELISSELIDETLEETCNQIIRSVESGFEKQKSPRGGDWEKNPSWWQNIKGHKMANIGIPPSTTQIGSWEYPQSKKHMKDSLGYRITGTGGISKKATIEYETQAQKRAKDTQLGGIVEFKRKHKSGGEYSYMVNVISRPHMGFTTGWGRHPSGKTDINLIIDIWTESINNAIKDFIGKI